MAQRYVLVYLLTALSFSINGTIFPNFLRASHPQEKSQIPEALITIGQGANNLAKNGITIQAQNELIESLNNVAASAHELSDKGIALSCKNMNIASLQDTVITIIKSGCVAALGTGLSMVSIYYFYKSCFNLQTINQLDSQKKAVYNHRRHATRLLLPLVSVLGLSAGLAMIRNCDRLVN